MNLSELKTSPGSRRRKKIVGRGIGSGHGKTSTHGGKGQTARRGVSFIRGFEGGQMPLYRRLPKKGFNNAFKKEFVVVNVKDYNVFSDGQDVKPEDLVAKGIIRNKKYPVKILGDGDLKVKCKIHASACSKQAAEKIKKAGGELVMSGGKS
jgi:large subunit ribosomal protein L15